MRAWSNAPLGDLCTVCAGGTPSRANQDYWDGDIPWVKISDMLQGSITDTEEKITRLGLENSAAKVLPSGTLLLSIFATIGRTAILEVEAATNQAIVGLTVKDSSRLDQKYLRRFLELKSIELKAQARGVAQANINGAILKSLKIPLPSLNEQKRIAEILDKAEELRAKRRAAIAQLDSLTQSIFLEMFGDLVSNPKYQHIVMLGDVADVLTGYPFRSQEYVAHGDSIRLCRGTNVLPGRVDWSDLASWPKSKLLNLDEFYLAAGDILIAMDRPWISEGFKIASVKPVDCPSLLVQRVARLRGQKGIPNEFLYHLLKQPAFTRHCRPTETTIPHISPKDIKSFAFPLPPIEIQRDFAYRVTAIEKLKSTQLASLAELDTLFASLQHRAFSR